MKRFLNDARLRLAVVVPLAVLALLAVAVIAPSLDRAGAQITTRTDINTPRVQPRYGGDNAVRYIRTTLTYNMCTQASNSCTVESTVAALPYNAVVLRVNVAVYNAFNSTSSDVIIIGTTKASANEIVSSSISLASAGLISGTVVTASPNTLGNTAAQSTQVGADGGFPIWIKWTAGTGNTATAGLASVIIEYSAPDDGTCTVVPLGSTAAGC